MDSCLTFNCSGKVNCNDWELNNENLFVRGEVDNLLYLGDTYRLPDAQVQIFNCNLPAETAILDLKHFTKCMSMQLKILGRHETYNQILNSKIDDINFYYIRRAICEFILYVRTYLCSIEWDLERLQVINKDIEEELNTLFISIERFLSRLQNIPDATFHYAPSKLGNQCNQPEYHMYHMHVELRWLFLSLVYTRNFFSQYSMETRLDEFEIVQRKIIRDLIYISLKVFKTMPLINIQQKTPYNCTCIRELWLMIQIFTDAIAERTKSKIFWDYVNDCINELLNRNGSNSEQESWANPLEPCKNSELFCLWITYNLTLLYGYNTCGSYVGSKCSRIKPNYEQLEKILKTYVSKGGKAGERDEIDEELRIMIPLLNTIVNNWWQPRVSIISLLWDCFHKRLDEPFLLQTSGPWTLSIEKKTPMDILKQVRDRINNADCVRESSYGMFLRLVGSLLRISYNTNDTKHWNQIKGRIYSKFSKSKVQEFSPSGLYNFISLFLTLAVTADTTNVCSVMLDLLPSTKEYNNENGKKYNLIWKGKLAILLLYNDLRLNFSNIAPAYTDTVNTISCRKDDTSRSMMTHFIDVFNVITLSSKMELGEHLFVDGWIDRYFVECSNRMIGTLTRVLVNIFEKCRSINSTDLGINGAKNMIAALWCHVACRVRLLLFDPNLIGDHYRDISKLAIAFTLEALKDPATAKKHKHSAMSLFQHFASSIIVKDVRFISYYLALVLKQDQAIQDLKKEIKNFDTIIIQAWIKCSIIGLGANEEETKILQRYILQLNEVQQIFVVPQELREFEESNEPILVFIMYSMKKRNTLKSEVERVQYDTRWRLYFNHIEKWILTSITDETKDSELALWIYRCIGTLILCTSTMLYTKNQPNNVLRGLLNKAILSSEQPFLKNLGKKTFSMILLGIENLNVKSDISLQVLIRDLFDQYIPLLITPVNINNYKVSDTLLKCFREAKLEFLRSLIEMLMSNFLTISNDNTIHKHSYLIMVLWQNILKGGKSYSCDLIEYIITICTPYIIGCYVKVHDHHSHKQQTIDFVNSVIANLYYQENPSLQEKFSNVIFSTVQKSITTQQYNTFEFLRSLSRIKIEIIESLSPQIERTLTELEWNRRPNAASARNSWNHLQTAMKSIKRDRW